MPPSKSAEYDRRGDAHHPAAAVPFFPYYFELESFSISRIFLFHTIFSVPKKTLDDSKVFSLLNKAVKPARKPRIETIKRGNRTYFRLYLGVDDHRKAVHHTVVGNRRDAQAALLRFMKRIAKCVWLHARKLFAHECQSPFIVAQKQSARLHFRRGRWR